MPHAFAFPPPRDQHGNVWGTFLAVLAVMFIALKVAGIAPVAAWSWWLVLAPILAPIVLTVTILVGLSVITFLKELSQ